MKTEDRDLYIISFLIYTRNVWLGVVGHAIMRYGVWTFVK